VKVNLGHTQSSGKEADEALKVDIPLPAPAGSVAGGGNRAGLFRTPISGGVQSATSAHGLPRPALAVRNLMEQVNAVILLQDIISSSNFFLTLFSVNFGSNDSNDFPLLLLFLVICLLLFSVLTLDHVIVVTHPPPPPIYFGCVVVCQHLNASVFFFFLVI
jgi:hypothetical protein